MAGVSADDSGAMAAHAWAIWAGLTAVTANSGGWPVFETWYTDSEVSAGPPTATANARAQSIRASGRTVHNFISPRQLHHHRPSSSSLLAANGIGEQVIGFNKFNVPYAEHVWQNDYRNPATVWKLQASLPPTPVSQRTIQLFTPSSIGLKPVFMVVAGPNNGGGISGFSVLERRSEDRDEQRQQSRRIPTSQTWKQCVVVYTGNTPPPASATAGLTCPAMVNGQFVKPSGTVSVKQFYNFSLDKEEAANICQVQSSQNCAAQPGDVAILVAMHVTTDEVPVWTWQTFWWNYQGSVPRKLPSTRQVCPRRSIITRCARLTR